MSFSSLNLQNFYDDVERVFTEQIPSCSDYSLRGGQLDMAMAVASALAEHKFLAVQAGTGVGKTLAYLIPGVIWRTKYEGDPVLVATNTTNLQQQIMEKDYRFITDRLNIPFKMIQAMGRSRYLCRMRMHRLLGRCPSIWSEDLAAIRDAVADNDAVLFGGSYDYGTEPLHGTQPEFAKIAVSVARAKGLWNEICCDNLTCRKRACSYFKNCFFYTERRELSNADVVIANQALLCSVLKIDALDRFMPAISLCIVDEAHHLEQTAIDQFSHKLDSASCGSFINSLADISRMSSDIDLLERSSFKCSEPQEDLFSGRQADAAGAGGGEAGYTGDNFYYGGSSDAAEKRAGGIIREDAGTEAAWELQQEESGKNFEITDESAFSGGTGSALKPAEMIVSASSGRRIEAGTYAPGWFSEVNDLILRQNRGYSEKTAEASARLSRLYWGAFHKLHESLSAYMSALKAYYESGAYKSLQVFKPEADVPMLDEHWLEVDEPSAELLADSGREVMDSCRECIEEAAGLKDCWSEGTDREDLDSDPVFNLFKSAAELFSGFLDNFQSCHCIEDEEGVMVGHWLEAERDGRIRLRSAVVDVSAYLASTLFAQINSVVLASATLQAGGDFRYFCSRVGLSRLNEERVHTLTVSSPFRYREQALLAVASDVIRSGGGEDSSFLSAASEFIMQAARLWKGRTLVLANSRSELDQIFSRLEKPLADAGITALKQNSGLRAGQVERLRNASAFRERIVLMGTDSFWEGVDIAGAALSCVIILRLPFASPTTPVSLVRSMHLGSGKNFSEYILPAAVLKFCQGFGRLIRTEQDRGVVFLLDNRLDYVYGKQYRRNFLSALPDCSVMYSSWQSLLPKAWNWFCYGGS